MSTSGNKSRDLELANSGGYAAAVPARDDDADPEQIRMQIEQTRDDMSETIDAIQERLNPRHLVEQAKDSVRDATIGKVKDMANNVSDTASDMADSTMQAASDVAARVKQNPWPMALAAVGAAWFLLNGSRSSPSYRAYDDDTASDYDPDVWPNGGGIMDTVRDNPVPAAMAGLGLGWLVMKARQDAAPPYRRTAVRGWETAPRDDGGRSMPYREGDWRRPASVDVTHARANVVGQAASRAPGAVGDAATRAQGAVTEAAGRAKEAVSDTVERTQQRVGQLTKQARHQTEDVLSRNPLLLGAVAVVAGAAVGLSLPETEPENRLMGDARQTLVDRAQGAAQMAAETVKDVASNAAQTAVEKVKEAAGDGGEKSR